MSLKNEHCHISIVEPSGHFGEAMKSFLDTNMVCKSNRIFSSWQEFEDDLESSPIPDILIIDTLILQEKEIANLRGFIYLFPGVKCIAISMHNGIPSLADIIRLGFKGYIGKNNVYTQLIPVIRSILQGKHHFKGHLDY